MTDLKGCIKFLLPPAPKFIRVAHVSVVFYNICPLSGTILGEELQPLISLLVIALDTVELDYKHLIKTLMGWVLH